MFCFPLFRAKRAQVPREGRRAERGMQRSDDGETDKQQWGREGDATKVACPPPSSSPIMASGGLAIVSGGEGGCRCAYTRARGHRMGMQHFFNVFIFLFVPGPEARAGPHPAELPEELPGAVADVGGRQGQVGLGGGQGGGRVLGGGPSSVRPPLQRERGRPRRGRDGRQRRRGLRGGRRRDRKKKRKKEESVEARKVGGG